MTDILNLKEQIEIAVSLAEGQFREFKSALQGPPGSKQKRSIRSICEDVSEALVAFANADGGELLIGVEDDGTLTGTAELADEDLVLIKGAPVTHVHPRTPLQSVLVRDSVVDGHRIIYFRVAKGTHQIHLTANGRCLRRNDLESTPVAVEEIQFQRLEVRSREYDREFVDGATVADLDASLLRIIADQIAPGISIDKCLQYLGLAEYDASSGLKLRRGAILLFAQNCDPWHPRVQVRVLKVKGTEIGSGSSYNVSSDNTVKTNIIRLIDESWEELRTHLVETRFQDDARFRSTLIYPEVACREALVNAIAHRDYSEEGRGIEVYIYDDRIEIVNPGGLLSSISLDDIKTLKGAHQSRNSFVARALREVGVMRELGEGMRRIHELMLRNELAPPEIVSDGLTFGLSLYHRPMYSKDETLWLSQYESILLNAEEKAIILIGRRGDLIAPNDVITRLGIVDIEHYRKLIDSLQKKGLLVNTKTKSQVKSAQKRDDIGARDVSRFKIIPFDQIAIKTKIQKPARAVPKLTKPKAFTESTSKAGLGSRETIADLTMYVANIPPNTTKRDLFFAFRDAGTINSAHIPQREGLSRGYAFVEFENAIAVQKALALEPTMGGRKLTVRRSEPKKPK